MGQKLSNYTNVTYLQRIDMRLVDYTVLEAYGAALLAYYPVPLFGPQKLSYAVLPLSNLRQMTLEHLERVLEQKPLCILHATGTRPASAKQGGPLLVVQLNQVPHYGDLSCFEGTIRMDPLTGAAYIPHDDSPRLSWWYETCEHLRDVILNNQATIPSSDAC